MMGGPGRALGPLAAGVVIGVSEAVTMAVTAPAWAPVVSFTLLILLLLAATRESVSRSLSRSWSSRRRWPRCRLLGLPPFYETFLYLVFHWIVLATSWNILSGYSGYISFGHGAFFGAGVYATATLAARYDVPFLWTLPVAAAVAAGLSLVIGLVVFRVRRVRGELFALLTLAVTFVLATIILNTPLDGGPGVYLSAVPLPQIGPNASSTFYLMALALAFATVLTAYLVSRARLGRGLFAIHDDEDVAEVMGVPTYRFKLAAFALSCALAGIAGGIHALFVSYVTVGETFSITLPLSVVLMSILGGTRHWAGPAVGAAVITALMYAFTAGDYAIAGKAVVGLVLVLVILFMPQGILGRRRARAAPAPAETARAGSRRANDVPIARAAPAVRADAPAVLEITGLAQVFCRRAGAAQRDVLGARRRSPRACWARTARASRR